MELITEIFNMAKLFMTEGLPFGNDELLMEMCNMAKDELMHRLKDEVDVEDIRQMFVRSAGILAVSLFLGLDMNKLASFTVGSVQVRRDNVEIAGGTCEALRRQAELLLLGYLDDNGFVFRTVRY